MEVVNLELKNITSWLVICSQSTDLFTFYWVSPIFSELRIVYNRLFNSLHKYEDTLSESIGIQKKIILLYRL